jgi:hypothetical protein
MSTESNLPELKIGDVPEFKSLDDYLKNSKKLTVQEAHDQIAEGKLVNYITESQLLQILSQRAIVTNVKK